jgi:hypothetical protein
MSEEKKDKRPVDQRRRDFLKGSGVVAGGLAAASVFGLTGIARAEEKKSAEQEMLVMYAHNAHSMAFSDGKLQLHGVSPTIIFFSDRPVREVGHMTIQDFVDHWNEGKDSFAADPPNAVLSIFDNDNITDVVIVLSNPRLDGLNMAYSVRVLDGELPAFGGSSSLFIDPIGMPMSPGSVAGVHRRERRRVRRHVVHRL